MTKLLIVKDFSEILPTLKPAKYEEIILLCDANTSIKIPELSGLLGFMQDRNFKIILYSGEPELYFYLGKLADKNTTLVFKDNLPSCITDCYAKQNAPKSTVSKPRKPKVPSENATKAKAEEIKAKTSIPKTSIAAPTKDTPETLSKTAKKFFSYTGLTIKQMPNYDKTNEDLAKEVLQILKKDTNKNRIQLEINKTFGSFNGDYVWTSVCYSIDKLHALALEAEN